MGWWKGTVLTTIDRPLRSAAYALKMLLSRGLQRYIAAGRPLLPLTRYARVPLRMFFHRSPLLRHDSKRYARPFLLWKLHDVLVAQHPSDFTIFNGQLRFRSFGSLMSVQGYYVGEIEHHLVQFVVSQLRPGWVMVDVGAHHGLYTIIVAYELRRRGWSGVVHSFEPDQTNFALLKYNVEQNGLSEYVVLHNVAVADQENYELFVVNSLENSDNYLSSEADTSVGELHSAFRQQTVETTRIDTLYDTLQRVHMIKIDIQGSEYRALRGAKRIITRDQPLLVLEAMPQLRQTALTQQAVQAYNYTILGLDARGRLCPLGSDEQYVSWDWIGVSNS